MLKNNIKNITLYETGNSDLSNISIESPLYLYTFVARDSNLAYSWLLKIDTLHLQLLFFSG
jgi:hypothetical protein